MGLDEPHRRYRHAIMVIVAVAILVRLLAVWYFKTYNIDPARDHWSFGYEEGRIARSLATGQGFSSPMPEPTGPTAFLPPAFPFVLAGIFKVFGNYTTASAIAVYFLDIVLSAMTCALLYALAMHIFTPRTALLAALLFSLYPPAIWHASGTIWDVTLLTFSLVLLLLCLYELPPVPGTGRLASIGLLMGLIFLINSSPSTFYPVIVIWIWLRTWRNSGRKWASVPGLAALVFVCSLICVSWMVRNFVTVGQFAPRSMSAVNFMLGNNEETWRSHGGWTAKNYVPNSMVEEKRLQELGEAGYQEYCSRIAKDFIRQNPRKFADLIWYRVCQWWAGTSGGDWNGNWKTSFRLANLKLLMSFTLIPLAAIGMILAWKKGAKIGLLLALFLIYPAPYYLFYVSERFRFPIEPFLLMFAAFALVELSSTVFRLKPELGDGTAVIKRIDWAPEPRPEPKAQTRY